MRFTADEVLEMGLEIERNGRRFYSRAAENAEDPEVRRLLRELADMEAGHVRVFEDLRARLPESAAPEVAYDPYGEAALYLRAAADSHVFNLDREDPAAPAAQEGPEDVLRLAVQFEKDTIAFFLGLRDVVPESLGREHVEELIREEMRHVSMLDQALRGRQSGGN